MLPIPVLLPVLLVLLFPIFTAPAARGASPGRDPDAGRRSLPSQRIAPAPGLPLVAVLCYHDVADGPGMPWYTVSPAALRAHIRRLKETGWTILSLSELLSHRNRFRRLPPRVAVLTFDDGYRSFVDNVLPILVEEGVTATLSVVDAFVDRPPGDLPPLLTWAGIRRAARSGHVEIASHSHDMHRYETSNPYRDTGPSASTRRYILAEARYEDREEYRRRIRRDLARARLRLRRELGRKVAVLAWPYGEHNAMARKIAAQEGFATTLGLEGTDVRPEDLRSGHIPRVMVTRGTKVGSPDLAWLYPETAPVRAAQVDLDAIYDPDPARFARNILLLTDRISAIGATHVFLQACPDPGGDGRFREAWFMNHQAPVRADVWSMAAAKLSRGGAEVWIRAPVMNLSWEWEVHPEWRIPFRSEGGKEPDPWYFRLSPDLPGPRRAAVDFFADIAVYLPIRGILFDDDAYMLAGERLRGRPRLGAAGKAEAMRTLIEEVKAAVLAWRPQCRFARNIYAPAAERDGVHPGYAQDLDRFLRDYDLTVVMAYDRMEGHGGDAAAWIAGLAGRISRTWIPRGGEESRPPPAMLKFQAYDWGAREWVPGGELSAEVRAARDAMITNIGVYPVVPVEGDFPDGLLGGSSRERSLEGDADAKEPAGPAVAPARPGGP